MTNESGSLTNHDESESGLSDTPPGHRAGSPSLLTLMGPTPKSAAGVIIPPLVLRSSATSELPPSSSCQLSEGKDHAGVVVVLPIFWLVGAFEVCEVTVGPSGLQAEPGLYPFFPGSFDALRGLFDPGLPDADLVFGLSVADEVGADSPVVVFQGRPEDDVVHTAVTGEGGGEPDGELGHGEVGLFVVSWGVEVVEEDGEPLSSGPLCMRVSPLDESYEFGLLLVPVVVRDVEPGRLSGVLFESDGAHTFVFRLVVGVGAAVALVVAGVSACRGLVLLVPKELLESILGFEGAILGLVHPFLELADGGGEVFGVFDEHVAVGLPSGLEDHGCCSG
jgi:hypothetical protein